MDLKLVAILLALVHSHPISRTVYRTPTLLWNQTKDVIPRRTNFHPIVQKPESITESGWKPIFYPMTKNIIPTSTRRITYNFDSINNQRYHPNGTVKNTIDAKSRLAPQITKENIVPLAYLNESRKELNIERFIKPKNITKEIDNINSIIIEKLQKTLEDFSIKFNIMLENAVKESTKKIDIHHAGQSSREPLAEAGYRGPPPAADETWTSNGTLHYRQEEEDTEPNQREVPGKQETADDRSTTRITPKNKRRSYDEVRVSDLNVFDWNRNKTKPVETPDIQNSSARVTKSVYSRGPVSFSQSYNSDEHKPPDPYVALFLSHYGKYLPETHGHGSGYRNLYSYIAANNIHNNKPFGSYKIYEDSDAYTRFTRTGTVNGCDNGNLCYLDISREPDNTQRITIR